MKDLQDTFFLDANLVIYVLVSETVTLKCI